MKALVTGGSGFIGRHMVRRLVSDGWDVLNIDPWYGVDPHEICRGVPMDCRREFEVPRHYDLVVHCAAVVGGRETIEGQPAHLLAENLSLDAELFRWALKAQPSHIVYFSSSAAYPAHLQQGPYRLKESDIDLDNCLQPDFTYGWGKLTGEVLAKYVQETGQKVHVFRPFSGYGEDQSLDYPFPSFIQRAVNREDPFQIWGDGTQVRDWIHVDDIVSAVMHAVECDIEGPVNLGWGEPVSFGELAMMVFEHAGYSPDVQILKDKPTGVSYRCADVSKMLDFYRPRVSLEEGIVRALSRVPV